MKRIDNPEHQRNKELLEEVYDFTEKHHRGQYRKFTGDPYFIHPIRVAILLKDYSDPIILSGLLHDVVEDCEVTVEDIKQLAGERVAQLVEGVTKEPVKNDLFEQLEGVVKEDKFVIHLKLADRFDNLDDSIFYMNPPTQQKYLIETPKILEFAKQYNINFLESEIKEKLAKLAYYLNNEK